MLSSNGLQSFSVYDSNLKRVQEEFRARQKNDRKVDARGFLADAQRLVDLAVAAKMVADAQPDRNAPSWRRCALCGAWRDESGHCSGKCSVRSAVRRPVTLVGNVRYGRVRLLLARFIGRWAWKGRGVGLSLVLLTLALGALTGCATVRVNVGCQATAPTVTNVPHPRIQKSHVCGVNL
ncbi:MAG: hypothetical protein ACYDC6_12495 [Acidobacteriaceae bacterium]